MNRPGSPLARRLLLLWGLFILYGTTIPFDLDPSRHVLAQAWADANHIPWVRAGGGRPSLTDAATNLLLFVPWGFLMAADLAKRGRRLVTALAACGGTALACSALVEALQLFSPSRTTSATDLVNNAVGGLAGGLAGWIAVTRWPAAGSRLRVALRREPWTVLALAVAAGTLFWSVAPFDLSLDIDDLKSQIKRIRPIPFGPPLRGETPLLRPGALSATFLAWSLIGGVAGLAHRARGRRPPRGDVAAIATLAVASEAVQLLVRSRAVDATTVLVAVLGGGTGLLVVGRFERPSRKLARAAILVWLGATVATGLDPWRFAFPHYAGFPWGRIIPFMDYFRRTDVYALADALLQILAYVPLGVLLALGDDSLTSRRAAVAGFAVGLLVESLQTFVPGRVGNLTDAALGAAGALGGVWLCRRFGATLLDESPR